MLYIKHKSVARHHVFDVMPEKDKGLKPVVVSGNLSIEGVCLLASEQSHSHKPEHITAPSSSVGQSLLGRNVVLDEFGNPKEVNDES